MSSKARRVVRDLFQLFLAEPRCLPRDGAAPARRERGRARADRRRLHRRHDRPLCARRAPPAVRYLRAGMTKLRMTNIFGDFRRLVIAALDDLAAQGALPAGLDFAPGRRRAAARPGAWRPRDQRRDGAGRRRRSRTRWHWRSGSPPPAGPSWRPPTTGQRFTVAAARPGFLNIRLDPAIGTRNCARCCGPAQPIGDSTDRRRRAGQCRICLGQSDRADARGPLPRRRGRRRARPAARKAGFAVTANITSTMPARRSMCSRARSICATARRSARHRRDPEGFYPGEYLIETGGALAERDGRIVARPPGGRVARAGARFRD